MYVIVVTCRFLDFIVYLYVLDNFMVLFLSFSSCNTVVCFVFTPVFCCVQ